MRIQPIYLLLCLVFLTACASPYKPYGLGGGYDDVILQPNVFQVSFRGNGYTPIDLARNYALLRAAELTIDNGYKYFLVVDSSSQSKVYRFTTPGYAKTTGNATTIGAGRTTGTVNQFGNIELDTNANFNTNIQTTTVYIPPQTHTYLKPRVVLTVVASSTKTEENMFDAAFLMDSLKAKYNVKP